MARAALDWFTVERIDETTFALTEDGHWEHVHCYLFVGSERAALIDTGTGIADITDGAIVLVHKPEHQFLGGYEGVSHRPIDAGC